MNIEAHINPCQMTDQLPLEVVERNGIGHPDAIATQNVFESQSFFSFENEVLGGVQNG